MTCAMSGACSRLPATRSRRQVLVVAFRINDAVLILALHRRSSSAWISVDLPEAPELLATSMTRHRGGQDDLATCAVGAGLTENDAMPGMP